MTNKEITFRAVPGPAFVERLTVATWLDVQSLDFPVAHVLISHAPRQEGETAESVEDGLLGMVDAMGMRPAAEGVPDVGARLIMGEASSAVDYGHPTDFLALPEPLANWRTYVIAGGPACLTIILDAMPPGAGPDAVEARLARAFSNGRAYMGATCLRTEDLQESRS
ncbi:hypothetical protein ACIBAC_15250 [Streptomyces sp. NPDC051362]|uniref:hypothetical protein n=1 Tax=Streptomyces sp. NPDC051362 TaxID=3365651 RepID=UPI003789BEFB